MSRRPARFHPKRAIVDAVGARAALAGAYAALQSNGLYGHTIVDWTELLSDNLRIVGTFDDYADADREPAARRQRFSTRDLECERTTRSTAPTRSFRRFQT